MYVISSLYSCTDLFIYLSIYLFINLNTYLFGFMELILKVNINW